MKSCLFFNRLDNYHSNSSFNILFSFNFEYFRTVRFIFLFIFSFHTGFSFSQNPYYNIIDENWGLPSNTIYDIFQDQNGFIWLGTNEGLTRFDGKNFKTFHSIALTSKAGSEIKQDGNGNIWYENFDGYIYCLKNDTIIKFNSHVPFGFLDYFIENNHLMALSSSGLTLYDLNTQKVLKQIPLDMGSISTTHQIGNQFLVLTNEILIFDSNANLVRKVSWETLKSKSENYPALMTGNTNALYCVSPANLEGVCYSIGDENELKKFIDLEYKEKIQNICQTNTKIWLCTQNGVQVFSLDNQSRAKGNKLFDGINVTKVFEDDEGRIWIGTVDVGLLQIPSFQSKIISQDEELKKIATNGSEIWCLDKKGNLKSLDLITDREEYLPGSFPNQFIEVGDYSKNIYLSGSYFVIMGESHSVKMNGRIAVKDVLELDSNYVVTAASGLIGMIKMGNSKSEWDFLFDHSSINPNFEQIHTVKTGLRAKSLAMSRGSNHFYCSTNLGLFQFYSNGQSKEIKVKGESVFLGKITYYDNMLFGLDQNMNLCSIQLESGKNEMKVILKSVADYFVYDSIFIIKGQDHLKIYRIDDTYRLNCLSNLNIRNEEIDDVLFNGESLYFVNEKGLVEIDVAKTKSKKIRENFFIDEVSAKGDKLISGEVLAYDRNDIEISFSILDLDGSSEHQIKFRINGGTWKDIPFYQRSLSLPSLAGGFYKIDFMLDGLLIENASVRFEIAIPWWKQNWLLIFTFIITLILIFIYFRWQLLLYKRKNDLQLQKVNLEKDLNKSILTSIKSQMNPHFFYNALNTIQSYIITNDNKIASSYLSKFSKLTRMILEMSEKEKITLSEELEALNLYLEIEKARFNEDFEFEIQIDSKLITDIIKIPPMLIQPFVENAIKHGLLHKSGAKKLLLSFTIIENTLIVIIDDNGVGRKKSEEINSHTKSHYSYAIKANEKRLSILNLSSEKTSHLEIVDKFDIHENSTGTIVKLQIPL